MHETQVERARVTKSPVARCQADGRSVTAVALASGMSSHEICRVRVRGVTAVTRIRSTRTGDSHRERKQAGWRRRALRAQCEEQDEGTAPPW